MPFMNEHRHHGLLDRRTFAQRLARHGVWALLLVLGSLLIGTIGFHLAGPQSWLDAFLNSAMLLGGMGPVGEMSAWRAVGKVFAALYALYAGLIFLVVAGLLFAPVFHRLLHLFHLETDEDRRS